MGTWYTDWPERLEKEEYEMKRRFPSLQLKTLADGRLVWSGPLITDSGGRYNIAIVYPDDFPRSSPSVYPVGAEFEGNFHEAPHHMDAGALCLQYPRFNSPNATASDIASGAALWVRAFENFVANGIWSGGQPVPSEVAREPSRDRTRVFISYSHNDAHWLKRLQVHLKPLQHEQLIDLWDDTRLGGGERWKDEIKTALCEAFIAVLLVSADYLASEFIHTDELPPLLAAANDDGIIIIPVIVSPCRFSLTKSLSRFQAIEAVPLTDLEYTDQEKVLLRVSSRIEAEATKQSERRGRFTQTIKGGL